MNAILNKVFPDTANDGPLAARVNYYQLIIAYAYIFHFFFIFFAHQQKIVFPWKLHLHLSIVHFREAANTWKIWQRSDGYVEKTCSK